MMLHALQTAKRSTLLLIAFVMFASILSFGTIMSTQNASAACAGPSIGFGRWKWCGYWFNRFDDDGNSVRIGGVPPSVDSAPEFVAMIRGDLAGPKGNHKTGAAFVVLTMLGVPLPAPAGWSSPATDHAYPSAAQLDDWEERMLSYDGSPTGNGSIDWSVWQHLPCGTINTYWQGDSSGANPNDVAPYVNTASNTRAPGYPGGRCASASTQDEVIIFRDKSNNVIYRIRRDCMNPLGTLGHLEPAPQDYNVVPAIAIKVNGVTPGGLIAEEGDTVSFEYTGSNSGSVAANNVNCNIYRNGAANGETGYITSPTVNTGHTFAGSCPKLTNFPNGGAAIPVATETFTATGNRTICRRLTFTPGNQTGATTNMAPVCVVIANKPYNKVFGGDVSVGNNFAPNACTSAQNASIVGWNKRGAGGYAGAGTQYASYALDTIYDVASAQANNGGAATPTGLSFSNTATDAANGTFGGNFGASTGCIPDYFKAADSLPSLLPPISAGINVLTGSLLTANYKVSSDLAFLPGTILPGTRSTVYVDGDVYIGGNITYSGLGTTYSQLPLFQLVVKGNIYIDNDVTQLDGVYIAQPDGSVNSGKIFTCATAIRAEAQLGTTLSSTCNKKLTVSGSFVASQIELLRTNGSLRSSNTSETSASNGSAETVNYGPAFWIPQPRNTAGSGAYDSITSMPPVL